MEDNFDDIKDIWRSGNHQAPDIESIQDEIIHLRKQKRDRTIHWYLWMAGFSFLVILYVMYTDELNSIYKSISEFILLFTGVFLLHHSWKSIRHYQKEHLMNGQDFLQNIKYERINREKKRIFIASASCTLLIMAVFMYFFDLMITSQPILIFSSAVLITVIAIIWLIIRPYYNKKSIKNSTDFINTIESLLQEIQ